MKTALLSTYIRIISWINSFTYQMRHSLQERGERHGLTSGDVVIVKFHKEYWVAVNSLLKKQDPRWGCLIAGGCLGFVGGFIGAVLLEMCPCCLPLSCTDTPPFSVAYWKYGIIDKNYFLTYLYSLFKQFQEVCFLL